MLNLANSRDVRVTTCCTAASTHASLTEDEDEAQASILAVPDVVGAVRSEGSLTP